MDPKMRETIDRVWPKTRIELEKAARTTKSLIAKGEVHVRQASAKSIREIKKLSLTLKKDRLYFDLGKSVAGTERTQWAKNKKIALLLEDLEKVENGIKSINAKK